VAGPAKVEQEETELNFHKAHQANRSYPSQTSQIWHCHQWKFYALNTKLRYSFGERGKEVVLNGPGEKQPRFFPLEGEEWMTQLKICG
jgi:hypothetical protein